MKRATEESKETPDSGSSKRGKLPLDDSGIGPHAPKAPLTPNIDKVGIAGATTTTSPSRVVGIAYKASGVPNMFMRYDPPSKSIKKMKCSNQATPGSDWCYNKEEEFVESQVATVCPPYHNSDTVDSNERNYMFRFEIQSVRKSEKNQHWRLFNGILVDGSGLEIMDPILETTFVVIFPNAPASVKTLGVGDTIVCWDVIWTEREERRRDFGEQKQFIIGETCLTYYPERARPRAEGEEF